MKCRYCVERKVLDADRILGKSDTKHDKALATFESAERHFRIVGYSTFLYPPQYMPLITVSSPVELERKADRYLEKTLIWEVSNG